MKFFYIADIKLPSLKAYTIHVLKMVDSFANKSKNVELLIHNYNEKYKYNNIKKEFLLTSKNKFYIKGFLNKSRNNLFTRVLFGLRTARYLRDKNGLFLTRSFYCSFFLILYRKKHFLEIHQALKGLTKFIFINLRFIESRYITRTIFITKKLEKFYSKKKLLSVVLPDAVNIKNIKYKKKQKKLIKNIYYIGSFYKGRGINLILEVAKIMKNKNFILFGKRKEDEKLYNKPSNVEINNYIKYYKVPNILSKADLLLMPHSTHFVGIGSKKTDNIANFTSPIKMFEYLASGVPLMTSNLLVLKEILKHEENSFIVKNNTSSEWVKSIKELESNFLLQKKIVKNGRFTAINNTWDKRTNKIIKLKTLK